MSPKVVPFVLGLLIGYGMRWMYHLGYACAVIAAFFLGKHFG